MGCFQVLVAVAAQPVRPQRVDGDQKEVELGLRFGKQRKEWAGKNHEKEQKATKKFMLNTHLFYSKRRSICFSGI